MQPFQQADPCYYLLRCERGQTGSGAHFGVVQTFGPSEALVVEKSRVDEAARSSQERATRLARAGLPTSPDDAGDSWSDGCSAAKPPGRFGHQQAIRATSHGPAYRARWRGSGFLAQQLA
jgi:hypothetical protein